MRTRPINSVRSARKPGAFDWGATVPITSCGKVEDNLPDRAAYLGHGWTAYAALTRGLTVHPGDAVFVSQLCRWSHNLEGYLTMKLKSNTILITGGASGIGYELTKQLTALGNTILITGRDQAKMDRAKAAFPKIHTFQSDVSDPEAIATLY